MKRPSYYKLSADENHVGGALHYARCLRYDVGVGVDAGFSEASMRRNRHSFCCPTLATLNQFPDFTSRHLPVFEACQSQRPYVGSQGTRDDVIQDYAVLTNSIKRTSIHD
jgi:hypothetical protein